MGILLKNQKTSQCNEIEYRKKSGHKVVNVNESGDYQRYIF